MNGGKQVYYQCQRCGNCCRWPGLVRLSEEDVDAMAGILAVHVEDFIRDYTALHPNRRGLVLKDRGDGACVFLEGVHHCRVNAAKPHQCRGFPNHWNFPGWRQVCEAVEITTET